MLNSSSVDADNSPVAPASLPSPYVDQSATPYEFFGTMSDVGSQLGAIFGHDPLEWVPTPLEGTSAAPDVDISNEAAMQIADYQAKTIRPQSDPGYVTEEAFTSEGGWSFKQTMVKEVGAFQGRVQQLVNSVNKKGFNDGQDG